MLYMFMYDRFDHAPTINYYSWYSKNDFLVLLCNWIKISNYSHVHVIWFRIHAFMQTLLASQQYVICVIEELYLTLHYNLICCVITFKNTGDGKYFKIKQRFFFSTDIFNTNLNWWIFINQSQSCRGHGRYIEEIS